MGTTFIEDELLKRSSDGILTPMKSGDYMGLTDLIAGVTPTLIDWTNDPTDAADITDSDITTFCTTGDRIMVAWEYAYFEWDLGGFYDILITGIGASTTTAGTPHTYISLFDGANWVLCRHYATNTSIVPQTYLPVGGICSKVRIGLTTSSGGTITPNIREFHAWRL